MHKFEVGASTQPCQPAAEGTVDPITERSPGALGSAAKASRVAWTLVISGSSLSVCVLPWSPRPRAGGSRFGD